jgi:mRNA-degrading endonuclease toxin of MazEF toxin-antitoxin module
MSLPEPKPGLVIRYDYLWADERDAGRHEATKTRPCVVVVAAQRVAGDLLVTVVPVTHTPRAAGAVLLPPRTKARLRLDDDASWVVCTEINRFVWPGPDLRPVPPDRRWSYGLLPAELFERVRRTLLGEIRRQHLRVVPRA